MGRQGVARGAIEGWLMLFYNTGAGDRELGGGRGRGR